MLEIVNGEANKFLFSNLEIFKNSEIISMSFLLNVGQINNIDNQTKRYVCNREIVLKEYIEIFIQKIDQYKNVRIWYSSIDPEDRCFFLFVTYLINKFHNNKINVKFINVGKINVQSVLCFDKNEIENLFKIEECLNPQQIIQIANEWQLLMLENADLRLIENSKIKSCSFEFLDFNIIKFLSKYKEIDKKRFIISCMEKKLCSICGDLIFEYRINELIKRNKIKIVKNVVVKNIFGKMESRDIISIF